MDGNQMKMRDALSKIYKLVTSDCPSDEVEIANICFQALSAPPRNCDVIDSTSKALCKHGFPTKHKPWGEEEWLEFIDWLLAPIDEGADA